jgi:hypothetical protein
VRPIPVVGLVDLPAAPAETAVASRLWMRALSFAALAFYGVERSRVWRARRWRWS